MKTSVPYLSNGSTYGIGPDGKRVCTGSQMGRSDHVPTDAATVRKLHLRRVPFVDGCYDQGGAYWGAPADLYCAWGESDTEQAVIYMRCRSREDAKAKVWSLIPGATFYR